MTHDIALSENDSTQPHTYDLSGKRVWVAGHRGMVGSAVVRRLANVDCDVLTVDRDVLDLRDTHATESFLRRERPDVIVLAAARVGGIFANSSRPADFLYDNLAIQQAVIGGAYRTGVDKLLFLGSSCIYPRLAPQPIEEEALLSSALEQTNEAYAIAKIAGLKLCAAYRDQYGCDFISAMPTNLYGPNDNFDLQSSHVLPALVRKAHEAKVSGAEELVIWGSGTPRREFLHVDDCADALVHLLETYSASEHINVGVGRDITIYELAELVSRAVGFFGKIVVDPTKPDGTPRKLLSIEKLKALDWQPKIGLEDGVRQTYQWYLRNAA